MIISNSDEFQRWLKSNMGRPDCKAASLVTDIAASAGVRKHRWDSTYLPLVRAVLRHRAMTRTALQIASARKSDFPGDCAEYFLIFSSGTPGVRRLLMLGMLADAADEACLSCGPMIRNDRPCRHSLLDRRLRPPTTNTISGGRMCQDGLHPNHVGHIEKPSGLHRQR